MKEIEYYKINETLSHKYYQIPKELCESSLYKFKLNLSDKTVTKAFKLLSQVNLVREKRQGL